MWNARAILSSIVFTSLAAACAPKSVPPRSAADLCAAHVEPGQRVDRAVPATVGDIKDWMTAWWAAKAMMIGPDGKPREKIVFDWSRYSAALAQAPLDAKVAVCVISAVKGMMLPPKKFSAHFGWVEAMVIIAGPGDDAYTFDTAGPRDAMLKQTPESFPYRPPLQPEKSTP
jgi:hypothetical protein